jgi:hypothetical protein
VYSQNGQTHSPPGTPNGPSKYPSLAENSTGDIPLAEYGPAKGSQFPPTLSFGFGVTLTAATLWLPYDMTIEENGPAAQN